MIHNSADYDYHLTFNNFNIGLMQGQGIEQGLSLKNISPENHKNIALFAGPITDHNAFYFYDGAMSVLNPYIDSGVLKVIGVYPRSSEDHENFKKISIENYQSYAAKTKMEDLLANEAKDVILDAVLVPNDTVARAVIETFLHNPNYSRQNMPVVTGQDADIESIILVRDGLQYMTIFKESGKLAEAAIILASQILEGIENPEIPGVSLASGDFLSIGDTGMKIVKTFLLEPVYINQRNWNTPVMAGFFTAQDEMKLK
jgi:putative multiple sugar transport system substrate-binding protein